MSVEKNAGPARLLIDNQFVYSGFWSFHQRQIRAARALEESEWQMGFDSSVRKALELLQRADAACLLRVLLSRLYELRNQLMYGGATCRVS